MSDASPTFLNRVLPPFAERVYALLRIVAGAMFTVHGVQKIFGVLTSHRPQFHQPEFGSQMWIGGMIELVGGIAIALGLYTRLAAFLASGTMAVAYIQFHWELRLDSAFVPEVNGGELALLYSFVFLYMACKGDGRWSLGARRSE